MGSEPQMRLIHVSIIWIKVQDWLCPRQIREECEFNMYGQAESRWLSTLRIGRISYQAPVSLRNITW